jgi:hypothetical protein
MARINLLMTAVADAPALLALEALDPSSRARRLETGREISLFVGGRVIPLTTRLWETRSTGCEAAFAEPVGTSGGGKFATWQKGR